MAVTTRDIPDRPMQNQAAHAFVQRVQALSRGRSAPATRLAGLALIVFGLLQWLPAARFTVDGWIAIGNILLQWFGFAERVTPPGGWWLLALTMAVGLIYSRVETSPARTLAGLIAWVFVLATDVASTFLGFRAVPPDAWRIWQELAASGQASTVVAFYATIVPDWMILAGIALLFRAKTTEE